MLDPRDEAGRPIVLIAGVNPLEQVGGHESYVLAHALAAREAGYTPHIFSVGAAAATEDTAFGVVHQVRTPLRHFLLAPVHRRPMAEAVADVLMRSTHAPPHIVHGFGTWSATAVSACARLARRGVPAVPVASAYTTVTHEWSALVDGLSLRDGIRAHLWYHGWHPWVRTALAATERYGYRHARLTLVNYESVAALLQATHGPGAEIRRVPYTTAMAFRGDDRVSDQVLDPLRALEPRDAPLIVSVSRHDARKGLDVLLRALARLHAAGVAFRACLVGPGRLIDTHRELAAALGVGRCVAIPGRVGDVAPYLEQADVFVLPSLQEGSGSVSLAEALGAGTAVVASRCDGIPEDLVDGVHALLVAPGDQVALAEALARVLGDPQLRATLAESGYQRYCERFAPGSFIAALRVTYDELRAQPGTRVVRTSER